MTIYTLKVKVLLAGCALILAGASFAGGAEVVLRAWSTEQAKNAADYSAMLASANARSHMLLLDEQSETDQAREQSAACSANLAYLVDAIATARRKPAASVNELLRAILRAQITKRMGYTGAWTEVQK